MYACYIGVSGIQCAILWCPPVVLSGALSIRLGDVEAPVTGSGKAGNAGGVAAENSCREAVLCNPYCIKLQFNQCHICNNPLHPHPCNLHTDGYNTHIHQECIYSLISCSIIQLKERRTSAP